MSYKSKKQDPKNPSRRRLLKALGGAAPLLLLPHGCGQREFSYPPLTILLLIDALRTDRLSVYNCERETSPSLSAFGQTASVFDRCIAPGSWTLPTMLSLFTGVAPRLILRELEEARKDGLVRPERLTLAESLREDGVTCAGFIANPIVSSHSYLPLGFDPLVTSYIGEDEGKTRLKRKDAKNLIRDAADYLRSAASPSFLYLHFMDTHEPLNPAYVWDPNGSAHNLSEFMMNQYDGCIQHVDEQIGIFFNTLKGFGYWDDSLIIVTADHGEHLGKRHHIRGHGKSVYEELIRVPLLIKYPQMKKGIRIEKMTDLRYVYHLLRNPETADVVFQTGSTLLSETLHNLPGHERNDTYESITASREDGLKLISYFDCNPNYRPWELFQFPAPGREMENYLSLQRLNLYEKSGEKDGASVYRYQVLERKLQEDVLFLNTLSEVTIPVRVSSDPYWNEWVEANDHQHEKEKRLTIMFGTLIDYLYQSTRSDTGEQNIKIERVNLKELSTQENDGRLYYKTVVEYSFLYAEEPFPTDFTKLKDVTILWRKRESTILSPIPLVVPFFGTEPGINPASILCHVEGDEDMRYAVSVSNTPEGRKLIPSGKIVYW